ncbi:NAD(P)/FAD-dependent oxidoreductase [Nocardioides speluncae]|uniref:NAD(P)/FAD-dependent oxidoreductase n=1 Tax=Nocardioides speluncae TaxID=2670337 RepID=UPI000D69A9E6|nr:FAD-dependent oxidoreductase [Nocardioides speluncae]
MESVRRVVVVGASVAGVAAATGLRSAGFDGEVVLVGDEEHAPYDRPPLSKQLLCGTSEVADIGLASAKALPSASVVQRLGRRATALDIEHRTVELDRREELPFDGIVVATGSVARQLPGLPEGRGIHVLRTLDDAVALRTDLVGARSVVVIGAGFIGLEVACSARSLGLDVTVVESASAPLARVLGADIGARFTDLHRAHGVDVRCGVGVAGVRVVDDRLRSVDLDDGTSLAADVAVVGIGALPATDWLSTSGLKLSDGLVCDELLRAAPGIYAAGDVARWVHPLFGSIRVEHWMTAVEHARGAARNLVAELNEDPGSAAPMAQIPYFWSDQYGVKVQMAGWVDGYDEAAEVDLHQPGAGVLLGREGRLVGALGWSAPAFVARQKRLIAGRASLTEAVDSEAQQPKIKEGAAS